MRKSIAATGFYLILLLCPLLPAAQTAPPSTVDINQRIVDLEQQLQQLKAQVAAQGNAQAPAVTPATSSNAVAVATAPAAAPGPLDGIASVLKGATVTGLVDTYYGYNFNQPKSRVSGLRLFDQRTNQFALNLVELGVVKTPDVTSRLGYNITFGFGDAMNIVNASDPSFMQYLKETYLSYLAPIGKGLQIDFGKFVTPVGAEVIESNLNLNYSRGLLFNYAIPFYHFGGRAKYTFNGKVAVTGYLVNGWNDIVHDSNPLNNSVNGNTALIPIANNYTNSGKTGGLSFAWTPNKKVSLTETWFGGPGATPADGDNWRNLSDTVVTFTPNAKLTLTANGDYGRSQKPLGFTHAVDWSGIAGYAKYQYTPLWALAGRYEYYNDHTGFTTSTAQHINEVTGTLERKFVQHLVSRFEYRFDDSNQKFFQKGASRLANTQQTVMAGLIFVLEPDAAK
jgi:hypothetical protein